MASMHMVRLDAVFYLVSGALVYFAGARFGARWGVSVWVSASALSFLVVPDKVWLMFFVCVFGPCAAIQAAADVRRDAAGHSGRFGGFWVVLVFVGLFCIFGIFVGHGGGFAARIELPVLEGTWKAWGLWGVAAMLGFSVFSGVAAFFVNRGAFRALTRRMGRAHGGMNAREQRMGIELPRLWQDDE